MRIKRNKSKRPLINQENLSIENIKSQLNHTSDLKEREIHSDGQIYNILYINSLVDQEILESKIIKPLIKMENNDILNELYSQEIRTSKSIKIAINGLLDGYCLLIKKGMNNEGFLLKTTASIDRQVSEPAVEKTILGAKVGFVESLDKNTYLLRTLTKSPDFTVREFTLGSSTTTNVSLIYLEHVADSEIIKKVEERIKSITLNSIRLEGDIQDCIEDHTITPFPQLFLTERPDKASANLKDGRVALIIDGSPSVIILPATFMTFFQTPDDYTTRWWLGSFFRLIRLFSYIIALILPALYIAFVSFHYESIPLELVYSLQSSLSYVPFQPFIELMIMQLSLELLREASIRLPPSVATTFGIVGGLVVGTAMVEAGIVSYGGLIVVALTSVSSFVQPNIEMSSSIRVLGFPLMLLAATFGFFGIVIGVLCVLIHLSRLTSFGQPYFAPFVPLNMKDFKDTIIRVPSWMMYKQPKDSPHFKQEKQSRKWKIDESEGPY
ncbi:spore germination protein KA [Gracilibacillus halotolerans]|uniref:Spore germination protein KA n=1 Tax=Gracilibacillus halotolerans TaxID=74386 RepID=A0A841RQQ9_9BACI|nr:spore germination protein [Gracilibacillus halotolerans]MBB6513264.1 spore germination protein KA [Gracilibacillus halotolerans]